MPTKNTKLERGSTYQKKFKLPRQATAGITDRGYTIFWNLETDVFEVTIQ